MHHDERGLSRQRTVKHQHFRLAPAKPKPILRRLDSWAEVNKQLLLGRGREVLSPAKDCRRRPVQKVGSLAGKATLVDVATQHLITMPQSQGHVVLGSQRLVQRVHEPT